MTEEADSQLVAVIADFLEMGHVENILAMFRQDPGLYSLVGGVLRDERYMVRLGVAVLFEELQATRPGEIALALPSLLPLLAEQSPWLRGEAVNILGIINTPEARAHVRAMAHDPDPQVREMAADILAAP
jgi:HEAT repeat protein